MRVVVDHLADALHTLRGKSPGLPVITSLALAKQLPTPISPALWHQLAEQLNCPLPSLQHTSQGGWTFPAGWQSVADLAAWLQQMRPDLGGQTESAWPDWVEAQVFVRVRRCLAETLNVDPDQVTRSARLAADLGAE